MSEYDFNPLDDLIEKRAQGCVQELGKIWRVFLIAVSGIVLLAAERHRGKGLPVCKRYGNSPCPLGGS